MIIGICGFEGAGKDTMADYLVAEKGFVKLSFATIVKQIASILFGWDLRMLQGDTLESRLWREKLDEKWTSILNMPITPRKVLRLTGTESCRNVFGPNIFVGNVYNRILSLLNESPTTNIVVSDCRFLNEIEMVKSFDNSKLIHIYDNSLPTWFKQYKSGVNVDEIKLMHPSSYEWIRSNFDEEIKNNKSKQNLYDNINKLL